LPSAPVIHPSTIPKKISENRLPLCRNLSRLVAAKSKSLAEFDKPRLEARITHRTAGEVHPVQDVERGLAMKAFLCAVVCVAGSITAAQANSVTYNYGLVGTLAEDSGSGPSLVSHGGTLGPTGYTFPAPQEGLSLSGTGAYDSYSIDIKFYFNDVNHAPGCCGPWERILDFQNLASDSGLYSLNGYLFLFASSYHPGDPSDHSANQVFFNNTLADLVVKRDSTGLFSAYVNGVLQFSVMDNTGSTKFSGPNNIINFFIDDNESLFYYPGKPEAGTGFVDFVSVTVTQTPLPAALPLFASGLGALGLLGWRRKRKAAT
jgi:hypothetical protein